MKKVFFIENIKDFELLEKYFSLKDFNERLDMNKLITIIREIDKIPLNSSCEQCRQLKNILIKQNEC